MMEFCGTLVYFFLIFGIGMVFARRFEVDAVCKLAISFLVGSLITNYVMFSLALFYQVNTLAVSIFISVALIIFVITSRDIWSVVKETKVFVSDYLIKDDKWSKIFLVVISLIALWMILLSTTPPRAADALRSHLVQIKDIVDNHGFIFRPYCLYNVPMFFTLTFLPVFYAFKGVGLQFSILFSYFLSFIFILRLAKVSRIKSSRLLVLIITLIPIFFQESHQVYNDLVVILFILIAFFLLTENFSKEPDLRFYYLAFVSIGFSIGVKLQTVLVIPWIIVLGWQVLKRNGNVRYRFIHLCGGLLMMMLIPSPIFLRNFINVGNPIWPMMAELMPAKVLYWDQIAKNFVSLHKGNYSLLSFIYAIKSILLYPLIPCTIWILAVLGAITNRGSNRLYIGNGLILYFGAFWVINPNWGGWMWRYSIWILPLGVISAIMFYEWLQKKKFIKLKIICQMAIVVTITYGIGIGIFYSKGYLEYIVTRDLEKYHKATYYWSEYNWINNNIPKNSNFLVIVGAGQTYYLDRPYIRGDDMSGAINWNTVNNILSLNNILKDMKINYVFYVRNKGRISKLLDEFSLLNSTKVILDRKTTISTQRIMGTFTMANVRLLKIL